MSRYYEGYYQPEYDNSDWYSEDEFEDCIEDRRPDMGYLEDDIEEFGEYDDDFSSIWNC